MHLKRCHSLAEGDASKSGSAAGSSAAAKEHCCSGALVSLQDAQPAAHPVVPDVLAAALAPVAAAGGPLKQKGFELEEKPEVLMDLAVRRMQLQRMLLAIANVVFSYVVSTMRLHAVKLKKATPPGLLGLDMVYV